MLSRSPVLSSQQGMVQKQRFTSLERLLGALNAQ
jgi:hypothetical protein